MTLSDSHTPLVTIGITCFNAEATVERAVRSALAQDWPRIEVVAVDDASTDASAARLRALEAAEPRLRVLVHARNSGVGAARNTLVGAAQGDFLVFFDDDDTSDPGRVTAQVNRIRQAEEATGAHLVLCHTGREMHLPDGTTLYEPPLGGDTDPGPSGGEVADLILIGRPTGAPPGSAPTCSQMARHAVYRALDGFDDALPRSEDTDLNVRAAVAGAVFVAVRAPLVHQTVTVTTDKAFDLERRCMRRVLEKQRPRLEAMGWYAMTLLWLDFKYALLQHRRGAALARGTALLLRHPVRTLRRLGWARANHRRRRALLRAFREEQTP